jgi:putative tricarboxylic transport membrane protein
MRKSGVISSMTLLALALGIVLEASKLPFGKLSSPQPGFFPLILAIFLAIFSLLLLVQEIREKAQGVSAFLRGSAPWKRIGLATGALVTFALLFETLGYLPSTFLFMAFLLRAVERQRWSLVFVVAFSTSLVSYLLFGLLLSTPLPAGILRI